MTDRIDLTGLRVFARHGVLPHEQERGQDFVLDLGIEVDVAAAAGSDDLADTIDYGDLASRVHDLVAHGPRRDLIEAVASDVADLVLQDPRVRAVEVVLHKPEAPVTVVVQDVAVTLRREQPTG